MTTRARAAKAETQTSVTDFFRTSKRGPSARTAKKLLDVEAPVIEKPTRRKAVSVRRSVTPEVKEEVKKELEKENGASPPKRTRTNSVTKTSSSRKALFAEEPSESVISSLISKPEPKKKSKIRTVADLQAELAKRGAAKKIHEQNAQNKAKRVEEQQEIMKSPVKSIVVEANKRGAFAKIKKPVAIVPDYVLPCQKTPGKDLQKEEDDAEEQETKYDGKLRVTETMKTSKVHDHIKESQNSIFELPTSYEQLHTAFQHLDRIVSIISGQNRTCILSEIMKNVKNTLRKDFTEKHISQLLHIYSESYQVEMREQWAPFGGTKSGKFELIISPNLANDLSGYLKEDNYDSIPEVPLVTPRKLLASPMKSPRKNIAMPVPRQPTLHPKKRMDAARMRDRAFVLKHKLVETVRKHYLAFLEENGLNTDLTKHKRIHPMFDVNKHCPTLMEKPLPQLPSFKAKPNVSMKEYVTNEQIATLPTFVQKALEELKSPMKQLSQSMIGKVPVSPAKFAEKREAEKKSGAASLIERIRAKEAAKKAAESAVDHEMVKRKAMLTKLKERYVRAVCCLYTTKKARSMELDQVAERLIFSSTVPTSKQDVFAHVELLAELAPEHVSLTTVMGRKYLQMVRNDYEQMAAIVEKKLDELELKIGEELKAQAPRPSPIPAKKAVRSLFS